MSSETWDTLGNQKATNYALRADMSRDEFIKEVTEGLMPPPQYFSKNAQMNKSGYDSIDEVMKRGVQPLSPRAFEAAANEQHALLLDVRDKADFVKGFIPNSIFIGIDGSFAPWVGALIPDLMQPILLIAPIGREEETIKRLARVGYDNTIGYLDGGFAAWEAEQREVDQIESIDLDTFTQRYQAQADLAVLDVRKPGEYAAEHVETAQSFPLDYINERMSEIDPTKSYHLHCRSGYRSTVAASILKARGFEKLVDVIVPFDDIIQSAIPTGDFVCPTTRNKK